MKLKKGKKLVGIVLVLAMLIGLIPPMTTEVKANYLYNLWVAGSRITNSGQVISTSFPGVSGGTATFIGDNTNGTLILDNFHYSGEGYQATMYKYGIYTQIESLTIKLIGTNSITCTENNLFPVGIGSGDSHSNITITSEDNGTLEINTADTRQNFGSIGIYMNSNDTSLTIKDCTVIANAGLGTYSFGVYALNSSFTVDGGIMFANASNSLASSYGVYANTVNVINGGKLDACAGNAQASYGILSRGDVTIASDATVASLGKSYAIYGNVKNSIHGSGWMHPTQSIPIEPSAEGRQLTYKSVAFPPIIHAETPTFNPEGGTYNSSQTVSISCGTYNANIYYTLDGSMPTSRSAQYTGPIRISETTTIKAIAEKDIYVKSAEASATYIILQKPQITTLPKASDITSGETLSKSKLTGGVASIDSETVEGTFSWKNASIKPSLSDSNKTEYEVVFTPKNNEYLSTTCKVKLTVKKEGKLTLNSTSLILQVNKSNSRIKATLENTSIAKVEIDKKSKDKKILKSVSVKNGVITIKAGSNTGTGKITVTPMSGKASTITVKVQKKAVTTTKIIVNKKANSSVSVSFNLKKPTPKTYTITASPDYISTGSKIKVKESSSDKKIASYSFNSTTGKLTLTPKKKGKAVVKVTSGKKTVKFKITVKK